MKIGIDCRLWNETGVGRYIRNLIRDLLIIDKKNGYVLFVLSKDYESIKYYVLSSKYNNWKIVKANIHWHTIEEQLRFPQILNRENLDLVHFPYISVPIFYNKPFVVTIHDLIPYHFSTGEASTLPLTLYKLKLIAYKFILSVTAKKAKKIIAVSNATRKEIADHLKVSEEKIVVTYEGIDEKVLSSKYKVLSMKSQYFLYVGNAYPHKNLKRLLEAFNILVSRYPNISLILVGRQDYFYKILKNKVQKMRLSNKIVFLENVTDEELSSLYKNSKALVMPSLMEGFGLPAIEAMANGCLVLASDIPVLREVYSNVAIYFDPFSVEDIFKKMEAILLNDSNHFTQNIKNGFERAKMFSWEKMAKETLEIYEKAKAQTSGK